MESGGIMKNKIESVEKKGRPKFSLSKRRQTFSKTNNQCAKCGRTLSIYDTNATIDHIIPLSCGGINNGKNLIGLCFDCNRAKNDRIVYPSCYFPTLNWNSKTWLKANKMVTRWAYKNINLGYIMLNPLVYDELTFSIIRLQDSSMNIYKGFKSGLSKYRTVYKLEPWEVEDCISAIYIENDELKDRLRSIVTQTPTYVIEAYWPESGDSRVEAAFTAKTDGIKLEIDIIFSEHRRALANIINAIFEIIQPILLSIEIEEISVSNLAIRGREELLIRDWWYKTDAENNCVYKKVEGRYNCD